MGSSTNAYEERSHALGEWLAHQRVHLLTGGGPGVMEAVSRAFFNVAGRAGAVIGVTPSTDEQSAEPPTGYPNPWVEIPIRTHLPYSGAHGTSPLSRNHINVLTSHVVVALPGNEGTVSEIQLARRYGTPITAFLYEPTELPSLPDGVEIAYSLEEVQAFVNNALRTPRA